MLCKADHRIGTLELLKGATAAGQILWGKKVAYKTDVTIKAAAPIHILHTSHWFTYEGQVPIMLFTPD